MAPPKPARFWRVCRIAFRRLRLGLLALILALLGALLYLNQVGLPGFVKNPLLNSLRSRGLDLQFSRLRWRWHHGLVAENVRIGRPDDAASPRLTLKEMRVGLNYPRLALFQLQVDSLVMRQGRLVWPVLAADQPPRELAVDDLETELRLLSGDLWQLNHFQGRFGGARFALSATITNASAVRNWRPLPPARRPAPELWQDRLRRLADAIEQTHFSSPPLLELDLRGDARDLYTFAARLSLDAPDADTPWGTLQQGSLLVQVTPAGGNDLSLAQVKVQAGNAVTPWGAATNFVLTLDFLASATVTNTVQAALQLDTARADTKWGAIARTSLSAQWNHSFTNPLPLSGRVRLQLDEVSWVNQGGASNLDFAGVFSLPTNPPAPAETSWAWWTNLAPYVAEWKCRIQGVRSSRLEMEELICAGEWRAPEVYASRVSSRLYGGQLNARASLDVASREFTFAGSTDFDLRGISGLLTPKSRQWLAQYSWEKPPSLQAEGSLVLPAWTNRQPDWRADVKPTVRLNGYVFIENGSFRGVPATTADAHFSYTNEVWRVPDLVATRPEGRLNLYLQSDERTRDYYFRLFSTLAPGAFRPLLAPEQQRGFDLAGFSQPPAIEAEVWGRWYEHERIGVKARVAATNFTLRGQPFSGFQSALQYTNQVLKLIEPRAQRDDGNEQLAASSVIADFAARRVYVTNGVTTADPLAVARAIGPKIGRHMEPYRFLRPPAVRVDGIIPMKGSRDADLHFDVNGGPFEWWKIKVPRVTGRVDWLGERLFLRDVRADFYRGLASGKAEFDFAPAHRTTMDFNLVVNDADLHLLTGDLSEKTNHLEGLLTGRLVVAQESVTNWLTCQGNGTLNLTDGLIWDIPLFGIFSQVLDNVMPGLGNSRANEGSATFIITNGVVFSDNLEIRASMMRLQYRGTIDLKGRVNARAEAELLRDTWVVGRVLSLALWPVSKIFEYRITGTVKEPKKEPIFFVPRLILFPLHPIRTLKDLAPEPPEFETTNAPPGLLLPSP